MLNRDAVDSKIGLRERLTSASRSASLSALFGLTMLLSAALLFFLQPLFSKMILPRFGGAPAVWNTCLVFFQSMLLAGYVYSHVVSTVFNVRWQVLVHSLLLLLPVAMLPIAVANGWEPPGDANPIPWLVGLLFGSVGLPFFVVSTTAPLLQSWYVRAERLPAQDPYFLYAVSNVGSLGILVAYPLLVEPNLSLSVQSVVWSCGYISLAVLILVCGAMACRARTAVGGSAAAATVPTTDVSPWTRLRWLVLALVPSSLLVSVTSYLTADVASVPMLW